MNTPRAQGPHAAALPFLSVMVSVSGFQLAQALGSGLLWRVLLAVGTLLIFAGLLVWTLRVSRSPHG